MAQTPKAYYQQEEPRIGNQYLEDTFLVSSLKRLLPQQVLNAAELDLVRFGDRVVGDIMKLGFAVEDNPPRLKNFNAWGRRVDEIIVDAGWDKLKDISAEEGLIALGYEKSFGKYSRLIQYVKLYLFQASSGVFTCPLAMTDGAARLLQLFYNTAENPEHKKRLESAYKRLTSRDPGKFWTSGQWMTEKTGGSDVQLSETSARYNPSDKTYNLNGIKFFTSATTSDMAITLARISPGQPLSAFYIETRDPDYTNSNNNSNKNKDESQLNGISILRLKNKLGTKAVPTAELELNDSKAILLGKEGEGVKVISVLFNITRIFNACASVASIRRGIAVARDFASRRTAFGTKLMDNPLHVATIAKLEIQFRGCLLFLLDVLLKFGNSESSNNNSKDVERDSVLLRVLTPLLKLYTAKESVSSASECIESIGGTGYMEDSHMPLLLRNSQVESIWEGTTNVLSHDLWRPLKKTPNAFALYCDEISAKINKMTANHPHSDVIKPLVQSVNDSLEKITNFLKNSGQYSAHQLESVMREFAISMAKTYISALLVECAIESRDSVDVTVAYRFINSGLFLVPSYFYNNSNNNKNIYDINRIIAMDVDSKTGNPQGVGNVDARGKMRAKY